MESIISKTKTSSIQIKNIIIIILVVIVFVLIFWNVFNYFSKIINPIN